MLRFHTRGIDDARRKAQAAMALLAKMPTLKEMPGDPAAILAHRLRDDLEHMDDPLTYLVHEYLVDANDPLYFMDFLNRAQAAGLQYVDDAFPGSTSLERLPPGLQGWIADTFADYAQQQQYLDFFANVAFRRSLLCHNHWTPNRHTSFDRLHPLYVNATCNHSESTDGGHRFKANSGKIFSVPHPGLEAALSRIIAALPCSVSVAQLCKELENDFTREEMAILFDGLYRNAAVEFTSHPVACTKAVAEHPFASELVRDRALEGVLTNASHRPVKLNDTLTRHLLLLLDGTRNVPTLIALLKKRLTPDQTISDAQWHRLLKEHLTKLANLGLLAPKPRGAKEG
jgi:methyltransferase-like protein